jgi:DNA polymerase elongation subunit (family B)
MIDKIILPDVKHDEIEGQYLGAYVKDPIVGMYDWVMSFDATSLYPSIMMQHNISPETKVYVVSPSVVPIILDALEGKQIDSNELKMFALPEKMVGEVISEIKEKKYTISSNGAVYRHDKPGIVAKFVKEWFDKRKHHKNLMEKAISEKNSDEIQLQKGLQHNYKILINSVYGYVGSQYSRLYDKDNAVAVTATGQEVLKIAMSSIDDFFKDKWTNTETGKRLKATSVINTVTYGDTDSIYLNVGTILKSFKYPFFEDKQKCSDFLEKNFEPLFFKIINDAMKQFTTVRMNCESCKISFKREMIARRACFLAKKRYIAWATKMETATIKEGDDHEIEAKGIEMVKSSTPEMIRDFMREFILAYIKYCDLKKANDFIRKIYDKFRSCDFEKIAKIMNVNGIEKYTGSDGLPIKGSPNHVKASIGYNMMLEKHGLQDDYEKIYEGDKIKILYIKESPQYPYNSIAFKESLPEEFGLKDLVDHDIMWEKVFIEPIKPLYDVLKWSMPSFDLEDISDLFS